MSAWSRSLTFRSWTRNELVKTSLGPQCWADDDEETSTKTARLMTSSRMERGDVDDVDALDEREATWTMAWQKQTSSNLVARNLIASNDWHRCSQHQQRFTAASNQAFGPRNGSRIQFAASFVIFSACGSAASSTAALVTKSYSDGLTDIPDARRTPFCYGSYQPSAAMTFCGTCALVCSCAIALKCSSVIFLFSKYWNRHLEHEKNIKSIIHLHFAPLFVCFF